MDPLSSVLSLMKPRNTLAAELAAGETWAVAFDALPQAIKTGAVLSGSCRLTVAACGPALRLGPGDCFLLPRGRPFALASDPSVPAQPAGTVFDGTGRGGMTRIGLTDGQLPATRILSTRFELSGAQARFLLAMFPPVVIVREASGSAVLPWAIARILKEVQTPNPGSDLMVEYLAHLMLVEALRLHLSGTQVVPAGWLAALSDRYLGQVLQAVHENPAQRWSVESLARLAGLSRSSFAARFKAVLGAAPMEYLTQWCMAVATERLVRGGESVSRVAQAVGYDSEASFSASFKRVMGQPPGRYARMLATASRRAA
jgi:AraC-like DNA-binding protein